MNQTSLGTKVLSGSSSTTVRPTKRTGARDLEIVTTNPASTSSGGVVRMILSESMIVASCPLQHRMSLQDKRAKRN